MKKLLVVVDYQKDFVDGALGFPKASSLEGGICEKISKYLEEGEKVLFTYDTHHDNYLETREGKNLPVVHCIDDSEGHELFGKLKEFKGNENTLHYKKEAFALSPEDILAIKEEVGENLDTIEFVGVVTNMCVISNVVAFQGEYINSNLVVDASLCASFDDSLHDKALDVIEALQVKVINRR